MIYCLVTTAPIQKNLNLTRKIGPHRLNSHRNWTDSIVKIVWPVRHCCLREFFLECGFQFLSLSFENIIGLIWIHFLITSSSRLWENIMQDPLYLELISMEKHGSVTSWVTSKYKRSIFKNFGSDWPNNFKIVYLASMYKILSKSEIWGYQALSISQRSQDYVFFMLFVDIIRNNYSSWVWLTLNWA